MPKLNWIDDKDLYIHVTDLLDKAKDAKNKAIKNFGSNVIDPFSSLFEISGFGLTYTGWLKNEAARQAQKTLQNHVGEFHQKILGSCKNWQNMGTGSIIDLVSNSRKIIAEIKNKYNTIKGSDLSGLYKSMEELVMNKASVYKGFTSYYSVIIPKNPIRYDKVFTPSDNKKGGKCPVNNLIREIDGASFYELVTGDKYALKDLFETMPLVISDITGKNLIDTTKSEALFKKAYG